jgi:hypothetical protein
VAKIEDAVGSKTKPATAYLRIMSHYKLAEYDNCISAANAYLADQPSQDGTLQEISTALADSKEQIRLADVRKKQAQQQQAEAEQAAREKREKFVQEQAAAWEKIKNTDDPDVIMAWYKQYPDNTTSVYKAADERYEALKTQQAIDEWAKIQTTNDISVVNNFLKKYKDRSANILQPAQQRKSQIEQIEKYAYLQKDLERYKKWRSKSITSGVIWGTVGLGCIAGSIYCFTNDNTYIKSIGGGGLLGAGLGITFTSGFFSIRTYSSQINRIENEMNELRPKIQLSLQPAVLPVNAFDNNNLAYGLHLTVNF